MPGYEVNSCAVLTVYMYMMMLALLPAFPPPLYYLSGHRGDPGNKAMTMSKSA